MSNSVDVVPEQVCYLSCNFCHIVLAVSVPCSSLLDIVTVRCGHCTNLWSVNMAAVFQQLSRQEHIINQGGSLTYNQDNKGMNHLAAASKCNKAPNFRTPIGAATHSDRLPLNRQPEKRQRVPSAYNQFIKEEIQRIKANHPDISHREAFSTAAKNWAHFPYTHFGLNLEPNRQAKVADQGSGNRMMTKAAMCHE